MNIFRTAAISTAAILLCSGAFGASKPKPKKPAGGANQVKGVTEGKVGTLLFDGHWRFQVLAVNPPAPTYTLKVSNAEEDYAKYHDLADFDEATRTFTAKDGDVLIAVDCLAKNGQAKMEQLDWYSDQQNTALTDNRSNSYTPIAIDMMSKGIWVTKNLLQGSSEKLTMVFAVPTGTTPQDLVVTLKNWEDHKGRDVRIHLTP